MLGLVSLDCRLRQLEYFSEDTELRKADRTVGVNCNIFSLYIYFIYFSESFSKKETAYLSSSCFSYLFNASTRIFCTLSFAQSCKIVSSFSKLSAILKHRGENFEMMTSIVCLSSIYLSIFILFYLNTKSYHKNDLPRSRVKNITKTKIN